MVFMAAATAVYAITRGGYDILMVYLRAETKVCCVEAMETAHPGGRPYWLAHPELGRLPRCGPGGAAQVAANLQSGTALADAYAVGKILCPQQFEDIALDQKADEINQYLVGKPVYAKMKEAYGPIGRRVPFLD